MAKTITLSQAIELINSYGLMQVSGESEIISAQADPDDTGEDSEVFLRLEWEDDEGLVYTVEFARADNQQVEVEGCVMRLFDAAGDPVDLNLYSTVNLEQLFSNQ